MRARLGLVLRGNYRINRALLRMINSIASQIAAERRRGIYCTQFANAQVVSRNPTPTGLDRRLYETPIARRNFSAEVAAAEVEILEVGEADDVSGQRAGEVVAESVKVVEVEQVPDIRRNFAGEAPAGEINPGDKTSLLVTLDPRPRTPNILKPRLRQCREEGAENTGENLVSTNKIKKPKGKRKQEGEEEGFIVELWG
nr:hypothetical protein Iba_chr02dCG17270 [Ipomoea batatas]